MTVWGCTLKTYQGDRVFCELSLAACRAQTAACDQEVANPSTTKNKWLGLCQSSGQAGPSGGLERGGGVVPSWSSSGTEQHQYRQGAS